MEGRVEYPLPLNKQKELPRGFSPTGRRKRGIPPGRKKTDETRIEPSFHRVFSKFTNRICFKGGQFNYFFTNDYLNGEELRD